MRLKRSRLTTYHHCKRTVVKDNEGNTSDQYGAASPFIGESWVAGGKVQAEQYGQRLPYIRNVKIAETYTIETDEKSVVHYILDDGTDITELDGICLYTDQKPDYQIIAIKPYRFLTLEVERL